MLPFQALFLACASCAQDPAPQIDWLALSRGLNEDVESLARVGVSVDLAHLGLEKLPAGELAREREKRECAELGAGWFEALWVLSRALGLEVAAAPDAFRTEFLHATLAPQPVAYFAARKALVFDEERCGDARVLRRGLLRELVLASEDQGGGLDAARAAFGASADARLVARACLEGRAELVARGLEHTLELAPPSALEQRLGAIPILARCGLLEAAREAPLAPQKRTRPASSEMLLHRPAKDEDLPTPVELPALEADSAVLLADQTMGEAGLRLVLSLSPFDPVRALEAAVGWDGDRLRVWRAGDSTYEFAWRIVFDRELDARQLEALLAGRVQGALARRGATLEWCWSTYAEHAGEIAARLARVAEPAARPESDARSTEKVEAELLAAQPRRDGAHWLLPERALQLELPPGWEPAFFQGQPLLYRGEASAGFRDNLAFREYALEAGTTPERALEEVKRSFAAAPAAQLLRAELVDAAAGRALLLEYTQQWSGRTLHQLELQLVGDARKLALTATILEARWKELGAGVEALLRSARRSARPGAEGPK